MFAELILVVMGFEGVQRFSRHSSLSILASSFFGFILSALLNDSRASSKRFNSSNVTPRLLQNISFSGSNSNALS